MHNDGDYVTPKKTSKERDAEIRGILRYCLQNVSGVEVINSPYDELWIKSDVDGSTVYTKIIVETKFQKYADEANLVEAIP